MKQKEYVTTLLYCLIIFTIYCGSIVNQARAHWIQTHLEMTSLAQNQLSKDLNSYPYNDSIIKFLNKETTSGKKYFEFILDGVRDADLRVNGIYSIDQYCRDYNTDERISDSNTYYNPHYDYVYDYKTESECNDIRYKDIQDWPIGDHGFHPYLYYGFYSQRIDEEIQRIQTNIQDPQTRELLRVIPGTTDEDKLDSLRSIMSTSNALAMAEEFYSRAKTSWVEQRYVDALYNLGIVIHLIQDMTVPTHVHIGENSNYDDPTFEGYVWNSYLLIGSSIPELLVNYNKLSIDDLIQKYCCTNI